MGSLCASHAFLDSGEYLGSGVLELVTTSLFAGFIIAFARGPFALASYQKKVEKLMRSGTSTGDAMASNAKFCASERSEYLNNTHTLVSAQELYAAMTGIRERSYSAVLAMVASFGVMIFALYTLSDMFASNHDFLSPIDWARSALYCAALTFVLITPLAMAGYWKQRVIRIVATLALLLFGLLCFYKISLDEDFGLMATLILSVTGMVTMWALFMALISQQLRNVIPLFTLSIGMVVMMFFIPLSISTVSGVCNPYFFVLLTCLSVFLIYKLRIGLISWLVIGYNRHLFSNRQLQMSVWFVVVVATLVFDISPVENSTTTHWSYLVIISFIISACVYFNKRRLIGGWGKPAPLLLLRVFSHDKNTQKFLDDVTSDWSCIGPIHLVGGPDLAKSYLEPHECLLFMQDRMSDGFIVQDGDLENRIAQLSNIHDPDGRYRINEFFCTRDTWQRAVWRLVDMVGVILLDLRAFDKTREGAAFELQLLNDMKVLGRTVILTDNQTQSDVPDTRFSAYAQVLVEEKTNSDVIVRVLMQCQEKYLRSKGYSGTVSSVIEGDEKILLRTQD